MNSTLGRSLLAVSVALSGAAFAGQHDENGVDKGKIHHKTNSDSPPDINPYSGTAAAPTAGSTATLSAITNHGGPVMGGAPDVHLIWYGNWAQANNSDTAAGQAIVRDFMSTVGGSPWMKINTRGGGYTGTGSTAMTGNVGRVIEGNFGYLNGKTRLTDANIATVVSQYVATQGGASTNAIYFVLTSSNVTASSGFCTQYCGWHSKGTIGGVANVKYSFVGNANRCLASCAPQTVSPNNNPGVDGMVSVLAHELVEALSDPLLNAWYDSAGAENADKCAWTFGGAQTLNANGSYSNMTLGARKFLVQRNLAIDSKCYVDGVSGQQ
jgi:hypothetical protein